MLLNVISVTEDKSQNVQYNLIERYLPLKFHSFALAPFTTMQQNIFNCAQNFRIGMTFYWFYLFVSVGS